MATRTSGPPDVDDWGGEAPELDVPADADPYRCPFCAYPFRTERLRTLHLGVAHGEELDEDDLERYETEYDEESHDLFTLHVKLTVAILLLYMSLSYVYVFVWV